MSLRHLIQQAAHDFDREDNTAHDLWSWCPSHAAAQKHWHDYAGEKQPSHADLMYEVTLLLSNLRGHAHTTTEITEWFYCTTDDFLEAPSMEEQLAFIQAWFDERKWPLHIKEG